MIKYYKFTAISLDGDLYFVYNKPVFKSPPRKK